ncbi:MAG TPA: ribonuclease HII [Candidatus Saccharimonadales bacterium]|nr:ribonuclease HII [Candidatus Saccharimonadales bacterium]
MGVCIIIAGGDEAGRGAVVGPIVISIVSVSKGKEGKLSRIGVRDSKMLTRRKREFLLEEINAIAEEVCVYSITNGEINQAMQNKISINELEALNFAKLIDSTNVVPEKLYIDSPDVVSERFGLRIKLFSKRPLMINGVREKGRRLPGTIKILSEHKADARYPVVSAASIIAKVTRDEEIERIKEKSGVKMGSGYPSDKYTIDAIKANLKNDKLTPYIRNYWKTMNIIKQLKIEDFMS